MKRGIEFLSRWWIISSDVKNLLKFFSESKKKNFEYTWSLSRIQELLPLFSKFIIRLLKVESWRFFSILERERERKEFSVFVLGQMKFIFQCDYAQLVSSGTSIDSRVSIAESNEVACPGPSIFHRIHHRLELQNGKVMGWKINGGNWERKAKKRRSSIFLTFLTFLLSNESKVFLSFPLWKVILSFLITLSLFAFRFVSFVLPPPLPPLNPV